MEGGMPNSFTINVGPSQRYDVIWKARRPGVMKMEATNSLSLGSCRGRIDGRAIEAHPVTSPGKEMIPMRKAWPLIALAVGSLLVGTASIASADHRGDSYDGGYRGYRYGGYDRGYSYDRADRHADVHAELED